MPDYLPRRESELDDWVALFDSKVTATPTAFGLTVPQAAGLAGLYAAWHTAYMTAKDPMARTPSAVAAKNSAKQNLLDGPGGVRQLVGIIQHFPGITNTQRVELGITVPDTDPTRVLPPSDAPQIDIISAVVRTVKLRLHNEATLGKRAKPAGTKGALVFSYIGTLPPAVDDTDLWKFEANSSKTTVDIDFPSTVPSGSTVWFTALWYNSKGESGPATSPVNTQLPGSLSMAA